MKKFILTFAAAAAIAMSVSAEYPAWLHLGRYAGENKALQATQNNGDRVIFLGNSITEHWKIKHGEFFENHPNFVCRGISGETTCQFLNRFREDVINNNPAVVIINGGTNDIAENTGTYNADFTFGNIVSMAQLAKANGIKVILTSVLPVEYYGWNLAITDAPDKIKALNARIKKYADENGITYVDYYEAMAMPNGAINPDYSQDGVHPVPAGYEVMESIIVPVIEKELKKK